MDKDQGVSRDGLLRIFERFDKDGDGSIDEGEFGEVLDALGWDSPPEVRSLEFAVIDENSDGEVEFQEFAEWWLDRN
jgi:Ca2+-binding EF-hand superfamily protein